MYTLTELEERVSGCGRCPLSRTRNRPVFGEGSETADVFFIGEGPGRQEDLSGHPFVGPAGMLLEKAMEGIGLTRETVYIGNIVKCRPPGNRNPSEEEMQACLPFLRWQVALIRPRILVCLGSVSGRKIVGESLRITRDRGRWVERNGFWILPTFHPAAVLRDPEKKRDFWEDFLQIRAKLDVLSQEDRKE